MLSLSSTDLRRIATVQRNLLSLTDVQDLSTWANAVSEACRPLFHTDHVYYLQPEGPDATVEKAPALLDSPVPTTGPPVGRGKSAGTPLQVYCPSAPDVVEPGIQRHFLGFDDRFSRFTEAYPTHQHRLVHLAGPGAYHDAPLHDESIWRHLQIYQEVFRPVGIDRRMAISIPLPFGEAMLLFGYKRSKVPDYEGRRHRILELLAPALETGLRVRQRLEGIRTGLDAVLDRLPVALLVFDADGAEVHRNRAFKRSIKLEAASILAGHARRLAGGLCRPLSGDGLPAVQTTASIGARTYALRAFRDVSVLPDPGVIVRVERNGLLPDPETLSAGSSLTAREAEVALLVAEGLTDQEIADRLFISVYTARNHTARLLNKLRVSSRAGVALALLEMGD